MVIRIFCQCKYLRRYCCLSRRRSRIVNLVIQ